MQLDQQRFESLKMINNRKLSRLVHNHRSRAITFKRLVSGGVGRGGGSNHLIRTRVSDMENFQSTTFLNFKMAINDPLKCQNWVKV